MDARRRLVELLPSIAVITLILVMLQILLPVAGVPSYIVPVPSSVFSLYFNTNIPWTAHLIATYTEVVVGFLLAVIGGILLGVGIALSRTLRSVIQPLIVAAQVVPKIAFVPILFLWFGLNILPRLMTVFLVCFFPIVIDTAGGLAAADPDMLDLVRSFDSRRLVLLSKVQFPAALPQIFSGLRVAATLSMIGAVVSEFVSANQGLGYLVAASQVSLNTPLMFAAAFLLVLGGFAMYGSVALVERVVVPWRNDSSD